MSALRTAPPGLRPQQARGACSVSGRVRGQAGVAGPSPRSLHIFRVLRDPCFLRSRAEHGNTWGSTVGPGHPGRGASLSSSRRVLHLRFRDCGARAGKDEWTTAALRKKNRLSSPSASRPVLSENAPPLIYAPTFLVPRVSVQNRRRSQRQLISGERGGG